MNIQQLFEFCLVKKGVTEHFPFDEDTLVFKVGGKMFCLASLSNWENGKASLNLKCDPEMVEELRATYDSVVPGFHMSKKHWNTVYLNGDVSDKLVREFIDQSYDLIYNSLTKKIQVEIQQLKN
jgi:predicted DNA-binding protein (MmcQ/YjbR family)